MKLFKKLKKQGGLYSSRLVDFQPKGGTGSLDAEQSRRRGRRKTLKSEGGTRSRIQVRVEAGNSGDR